ncbi:MAG: hypothetical protein ACOC5T_04725 [Elusimicrobiota bacterium]
MFKLSNIQKQIILGIKIIAFGLLTWLFLHQIFYSGLSLTFLILTVISLILWTITFCAGILILDKKFIYPAFILSLLSFFIFFQGSGVGPFQFREALYYFLILILVFISFVIFRMKVLSDKKTRIKLHFWKILRKKGLGWVFTLLCLLIAFAYYFSPSLGAFSSNGFQISEDFMDTILKPLSFLGSEIKDFAREFINFQMSSNQGPIQTYVSIALAVGLFLSLRIAVSILVPIVLLLTALSIKLSINLGFVKIGTQKIDAERLEL